MRKRAVCVYALFVILLTLGTFRFVGVFAASPVQNSGTVLTTHNTTSYDTILIQTLIDAEIGPSPQIQQKVLSPYDDHKGNLTIGIGYNLNGKNGPGTLKAVAAYFGVDPGSSLLNKQQKATVNGYVTQLADTIAAYNGDISTLDANLNQVMSNIKSDASLPANFRSNVYSAFAFNNLADAENTGLFTTIENGILHEESTLSHTLGTSDLSDSLERAVLISLAYNGVPMTKSPKLHTDISNGNRAEAWYEIRYDTNAANDSQNTKGYDPSNAAGVATRRDYEGDMFGLYDGDPFSTPSSVTNAEATQVFAMVLAHEKQMFQSVIPDGSGLYNNRYVVDPNTLIGTTNTNYPDAIAAVASASDAGVPDFKIRDLKDTFAPAVTYLLTNSGAQSVGNVLVFQQAGNISLATYGGTGVAAFIQNSGAHTITMNGGSDLIYTNASDTITLGHGVDQLTLQGATTTVDASKLTQATDLNLLIDNITFGGAVISTDGNTIISGSTDSYGRTYTLLGGVLTITQGSNSVTIKGFESGDFGVDIQPAYTFTPLNVPAASLAYAINDAQTIAGGGPDSAIGFLGTPGSYTTFDYQPAGQYNSLDWDVATGINNNHQMVGYSGVADFGILNPDAWLFSNGGFSNLVAPNSKATYPSGINDNGQIVGQYVDNTPNAGLHGFLDSGGVITTLDEPGATDTNLRGINNSGEIVGNSSLGSFFYTPGANGKPGTFTPVTTPGGGTVTVTAINNNGQMTGYFNDQSGTHGFVYDGSNFTVFPLPGMGAFPMGINNSGDIICNDFVSSFLGVPSSQGA